jgi:hypothetical protein
VADEETVEEMVTRKAREAVAREKEKEDRAKEN